MPGREALQQRSLDGSCQSGKMAALLNSLFFVFKISFLPKYRVKYYDYIVNRVSLINYNWCVSLDISQMLALTPTHQTRRGNSQPAMLHIINMILSVVPPHGAWIISV